MVVSGLLVRRLGGVAAVAVLLGTFAVATPAQATSSNNSVEKLTKSVTLSGVLRHLVALQAIASLNGGNRASGGPGYDRSADYVATMMRLAGYHVTRQPFQFNFCEDTGSSFVQNAPTPTTYADQVDYDVMDCSGNGTTTGLVVPVDLALTTPNSSTSGCEASDFTTAVNGNIALLQRGTCPFGQKVANAEAAGATGVILMNQGNTAAPDRQDLFLGTLGNPVGIPAISVSYPRGVAFNGTPNLNVTITTETIAEVRDTENVIAESRHGDPNEVVTVGAHLDSEPDTAGINDNGSGSAGILEVALQMRNIKTKNKVRFAWWGAEESNLVGSTFYVSNLTAEEQAKIALYLNFDMIGSPNYTFGVYDGDDSAGEGSGPGPVGSAQIEAVFQRFFASRSEATAAADFTGRSDYGPFIATGIPAGGLFTGAEVRKTEADVALWGGVAGAQYDPCYHAPCDSLAPERNGADADLYRQLRQEYRLFGNVNTFAIDTNADAIATAVATFAQDTSTIPARPAAAAVATRSAAVPMTAQGDWLQ
ncbi:M28 family peptidase [Micromonospora parathelypteridis]|uniref:Zn-dependent M28 family amino/carboxypeptidase n=1 Tax=Micromonospora parathelypteridis TaxID=1839617 RepID=A0A840VTS5_9ACTN|nr:M28 family peptidase [Micromonospora parathelypteridis]MBB5480683.1 Zn-dependent M28 family amino/carboxypeptidase [Micromonospora parathelypteridis]GGO22183.1 aminopeptidase [Micromonospora parathelypteridis]